MEDKTRQYGLLLFAFLFAGLALCYYLYLVPAQEQMTALETRLEKIKQTLTQVETTSNQKDSISAPALAKLAETIPVKPYADQLIKDLDRLQQISQVEIEEASFAEQEQLSAKDLADQLVYTETETDESGSNAESTDLTKEYMAGREQPPTGKSGVINEERQVRKEIITKYLPDVQFNSIEITLNMTGSYEEIYRFVTEAQRLSRYLRVDELDFKSTHKQEFSIPDDADLTAHVRLTSYFAPQFAKVVADHPEVQVAGPSGKWNPMLYEVTEDRKSVV